MIKYLDEAATKGKPHAREFGEPMIWLDRLSILFRSIEPPPWYQRLTHVKLVDEVMNLSSKVWTDCRMILSQE